MRSRPDIGTRKYFKKLHREHGDKIYCPVCRCRPCNKCCPIGFTDEWEIAALTEGLADADPKLKP